MLSANDNAQLMLIPAQLFQKLPAVPAWRGIDSKGYELRLFQMMQLGDHKLLSMYAMPNGKIWEFNVNPKDDIAAARNAATPTKNLLTRGIATFLTESMRCSKFVRRNRAILSAFSRSALVIPRLPLVSRSRWPCPLPCRPKRRP